MLTDGTLLAGRVRYRQLRHGYRTGIEPVLLAASVTAYPGSSVVEAGSGAGAALLCLSARLTGVACLGVERDPELVALARANLKENGFTQAGVELGDILQRPVEPRFDHAIANPPWHDEHSTPSPDAMRDAAKRGSQNLLADWAVALAGSLRHGGTLTMIVPAAATERTLAAMVVAGCGGPKLLPLWPRSGQPARLMLLRTTKGGRGPSSVLPGLLLHDGADYSDATQAILRDGSALAWR
jgi:tRNA1Val (adenine37-N6)-methyltransferase